VLGHAVLGEKGVQEGTKHALLRVEDQRGRCVVALPPRGGQMEVQDTVAEGGV
jgi:hypothetical protein